MQSVGTWELMTDATNSSDRASARRPVLCGLAALAALFVTGAVVMVPRIESDLKDRSEAELAAAGIIADVEFSGQDASVKCSTLLGDPNHALRVVRSVRGVRSARFDPACARGTTVPDTAAPTSSSATTASTAPATTPSTTTPVPSSSAPTSSAPPSTSSTSTVPAIAPVFTAQLRDGRMSLTGRVATAQQRDVLAYVINHGLAVGNLDVQLAVDPSAPVTDDQIGRVGIVGLAMPVNLTAGRVGLEGDVIHVVGTFADDAHRATFEQAVAAARAQAELTLRPSATAPQAGTVEADLNALVAASPILFDKGTTDIAPASQATVQRVAGIAKRYGGLAIEVQGHTDSEGDPGRNLTLSEKRARAVLDALVAQGVPAADLTAKGFGETQLVVDQTGREIPDKSRRVVFGVTVR
jgi:OOP family OmpA-OmpF porin